MQQIHSSDLIYTVAEQSQVYCLATTQQKKTLKESFLHFQSKMLV